MFRKCFLAYVATILILTKNCFINCAIHPDRQKLLKDALRWMTLRRNGALLTDQDLGPLFLQPLFKKYEESHFYRTFIIAFQQGVLPLLTLKEGDPCNPEYPLLYKDPWNNSVTWHYQKKFTFNAYANREETEEQFCDYRKGLICRQKTIGGECSCEDGAVMKPIDGTHGEKRCLLKPNEQCALIDLAHGNDPKHTLLASYLPELIFNLEKPASCEEGTQCRFMTGSDSFPRCYSSYSGPFSNTSSELQFGDECAIGLVATSGMCATPVEGDIGVKQMTCYNFGPERSRNESFQTNKTGYCYPIFGPSSFYWTADVNTDGSIWYKKPLFFGAITPRTIPFKGKGFRQFFSPARWNVLRKVETMQEEELDGRCSVSKTEKWTRLYVWFLDLAEKPPQGQDFMNDASVFPSNMEQVTAMLSADDQHKFCRVYSTRNAQHKEIRPAMKCVASQTSDVYGNDGNCAEELEERNNSKALFLQFDKFINETSAKQVARNLEEYSYNHDILFDNPDTRFPTCYPPCSRNEACYKDFYPYGKNKIYNDNCGLINPAQPFAVRCHDIEKDPVNKCEGEHLRRLLIKQIQSMVPYKKLKIGDVCDKQREDAFRAWWIKKPVHGRLYEYLSLIKSEEAGIAVFCDRTKLQVCNEFNRCACAPGTSTRMTVVNGELYDSDYCYFKSGSCVNNSVSVTSLLPMFQLEKDLVRVHYGSESLGCGGNLCVHVDQAKMKCTMTNIGSLEYLNQMPTTVHTE